MRRAITFLLLAATAAGPLAAQAWIGQGQGPDRANRDDARQPGRRDAEAPSGSWRTETSPRRADPFPDIDRPRDDWRSDARHPPDDGRDAPDRRDRGGPREDWRGAPPPTDAGRDRPRPDPRDDNGPRGEWRGAPSRTGPGHDDWGRHDNDRTGWNDPRDRTGGPRPDYRWTGNPRGQWDARWRDDRRYDWQGYRAGNRALYRAPRYYDPRGGTYRRWTRGYRADPFFYGRDYWIADPYRYRLPPTGNSYRWVRYYDDVALIDLRNGLIEDILYSFFWR